MSGRESGAGDRVLVAGATGRLGQETCAELTRRGWLVRAMGRSPARLDRLRGAAAEVVVADAALPASLGPALAGVTHVFSCAGASVIPMPRYGHRTFTRVDWPLNRNLVDAAAASGVRKFVYVSVFGHRLLPEADFVRGHELVVEHLRGSGLDYSVIRPTGFFSAMDEILLVASRGLLPEFAGGTARTNPIHEADLAEVCADALTRPPGWEQDVGGPDALTRKEIAAAAWEAIGRRGREVRVPVWVLKNGGRSLGLVSPRSGNLMSFIADILVRDFVAPSYGVRHIRDYFRERHEGRTGDSAGRRGVSPTFVLEE